MTVMKWPFQDPQNIAVFTSREIVAKRAWIQYVIHDEDDGAWQFHPINGAREEDASIVCLKEIVEIDPSVRLLFDLPLGWCAWRKSKHGAWKREKKSH